MRVLVIEDELTTGVSIISHLSAHPQITKVDGPLVSVDETLDWLSNRSLPDLILSDIELGDGLSFEVFFELDLMVPVIFITAYDKYLMKAFEVNSIDYLLKPASRELIFKALEKFFLLQKEATRLSYRNLLSGIEWEKPVYKQRFVVKKGSRSRVIRIHEISFIEKKELTFLVTRSDERYVLNYSLEQLMRLLNPAEFFRISRQGIVHIDCVGELMPETNNLSICLSNPVNRRLVVSQRNVPDFRKWLNR